MTKMQLALARKAASDARIALIRNHEQSLIPSYGFCSPELLDTCNTGKVFHARAECRPAIAAQIAENYAIL